MRLLAWVLFVSTLVSVASERGWATELVMKHTKPCEVADEDTTLVKVFQTDKDVRTKGECSSLMRTFSAVISDRYLGIDYLVMPKGKAISFVPKPDVLIAGSDKTWCGLTQVMNRGQTARIAVRILPKGSDCDRPPEGSFFLREFRLERDASGQMNLKHVCLLPSKQDICIGSEQLTATGRKNADWLLGFLLFDIKRNKPAEIAQYF